MLQPEGVVFVTPIDVAVQSKLLKNYIGVKVPIKSRSNIFKKIHPEYMNGCNSWWWLCGTHQRRVVLSRDNHPTLRVTHVPAAWQRLILVQLGEHSSLAPMNRSLVNI